jgi:tRNA(Met) cytidine acetyltransferase
MQQRQCLILQGETAWSNQRAAELFATVNADARLWLSDAPDAPADAIRLKQSQQQLGREFSLIVFDAQQEFAADFFGAIIGTLRAGGLLIILLPAILPQSLWLQRFIRIAHNNASSRIRYIRQGDKVPAFSPAETVKATGHITATEEQQQAIKSVLKVVTGHRRRPLVISSDRGRGKSALLGMAAAELLKQGKRQILVTAPGLNNVEALMRHADLQLPGAHSSRSKIDWQQGQIRFIAPDALLAEQPKTDLLIVDEAAAIPAPMLESLLNSYSRLVFATTLHGYEGTGRGFALRFQQSLDTATPGWRSITLHEPVRWASNDSLEAFSFAALMLDAQPVADELVAAATVEETEFELLDRRLLAEDETALRQVFGLMVLAHYRTRPSDLQMMLDRQDISVAVLRYRGFIVATVWLVDDMPLSNALAQAVFNGKRRLKGRLLPQSLLVHAGLPTAGQLRYQRIIRIAVHPALQGRGLGSRLLQQLIKQAAENTDMIGTSFAMDDKLMAFWHKNGLKPVRIGHHQDQISGNVSLMMLLPVSDKGKALMTRAQRRFRQQWPLLLMRSLKALTAEQVTAISASSTETGAPVTELALNEIVAFARYQRPYESSEISLWQWLQSRLSSAGFRTLSSGQRALLIMLIMQQHDVAFIVERLGLSGRAALIRAVRDAVSEMLDYELVEIR